MNEREKGILKLAVAFLIKQIENDEGITLGSLLEVYEMAGVNHPGDANPLHGVTVAELKALLEHLK